VGRIHLILHGHTPWLRWRTEKHERLGWHQIGFQAKADSGAGGAANAE